MDVTICMSRLNLNVHSDIIFNRWDIVTMIYDMERYYYIVCTINQTVHASTKISFSRL